MINQQKTLQSQLSAKQKLLIETENDEKKYQQLLDIARAEFEAIQNVLAGGGNETQVGGVSEGQTIAALIEGSSCNSNGTHLHFSVTQNGETKNPFSYLRSIDHETVPDRTVEVETVTHLVRAEIGLGQLMARLI